jgi:hypothetical protein
MQINAIKFTIVNLAGEESSKQKRQQKQWKIEEHKQLIKLCIENDLLKIVSGPGKGFIRPGDKWESIAKSMKERGFHRPATQIKAQWSNEKAKYR